MAREDQYSSFLIYEINKSGMFSSRAPYYISKYSDNWHRTGKIHLSKTLYSKKYHYGFKTSNKNSGFCGEM